MSFVVHIQAPCKILLVSCSVCQIKLDWRHAFPSLQWQEDTAAGRLQIKQ